MSHQHFFEAYAEVATAPWDIGRPQPALADGDNRAMTSVVAIDLAVRPARQLVNRI